MKKEPNIKIFVTHFNKPDYIYEDDVFVPIQAWKKNAKIDLWIQWDDTWDNISEKNPQYAELTTQYWVWKNYDLSDVDYVWFCHYRRYLDFKNRLTFNHIKDIINRSDWLNNLCSNLFFYIFWYNRKVNYSKNSLRKYSNNTKNFINKKKPDIVLWKRNIGLLFKRMKPLYHMGLSDLYRNILQEIIINKYPSYKTALENIQNIERVNYCNIFIMKKKIFIEYSERLFSVLFELEKQLKIKNIIDLSSKEFITTDTKWTRFLWCLGERLLNLFIYVKKDKIDNKIFYSGVNVFLVT